MQSKATTVSAYLNSLPEEQREVIVTLRRLILEHLPDGYEECMRFGMISYEIPLSRYPKTYNNQPLGYVGLGAQKNHFGLYLMCLYANEERLKWMREEFEKAGKKLDMGKACVRFRKLDDLPLDVIGQVVETATPDEYIRRYEELRAEK